MKAKINGKWYAKHVSDSIGHRADKLKLTDKDLEILCRLDDRDIATYVRQLNARVRKSRRVKDWLLPHQRATTADLKNYMTEALRSPPGWPSGGPVSGRFSSNIPARPQEVPGPVPNSITTRFEIPGRQHGKKSALAAADFSEIEKRVMATIANKTAVTEAMMGAQKRHSEERIAVAVEIRSQIMSTVLKDVAEVWIKAAVSELLKKLQTQIDEEGCGAAMSAMKYPKGALQG